MQTEETERTTQLRLWLAAALPLLLAVLALLLEALLLRDPGAHESLGGRLTEPQKQAILLDADLARWFFGLASSVIGGVVYYLQAPRGELAAPTRMSRLTTALAVLSAVVSIFFGHLWLAGLRSQLSADYWDRSRLLLPERLQYGCFLLSIGWFLLLVLDRESSRLRGRREHEAPRAGGPR